MENNGRSPSLLIFSRSPTVPQLGPLAEGTEGIVKAKLGVSFSAHLHALANANLHLCLSLCQLLYLTYDEVKRALLLPLDVDRLISRLSELSLAAQAL